MSGRGSTSPLTHGAVCLVTGANRGIGLAIARALAERPVRLLVGVRDPGREVDIPVPPGGAVDVRRVRIDLVSAEAIEESCAALGEDLGRIDVLVNNAGLYTAGLLEEQSVADVYAMFQANLVGLVHLTMRVLPGMLSRGRGLVVDNASISAYAHLPTASTYAATKAGVAAFTTALHREVRGTGVRTLTLVTPAVATEMLGEVDQTSGRFVDTSRWTRISPEEWAARVVRSIEHGDRLLEGTRQTRVLRLLTRAPLGVVDAVSNRMFHRAPRA
ncbi:MAG TPA: SDR family NAD(P)-dependent oxidoreductase [Candidatus Dormibacteraeota bacterium]|nr:SDR family NAD(P)-dependent oxidoreductase [Candidatus Dormibacteraeota bacterium]